jgi:hypothetical protein
MSKVLKPPTKLDHYELAKQLVVFCAGSIEQGKSVLWQIKIENGLSKFDNVIVLNPRRDEWDSSWKQSIDNPQFNEQVTWELDGQDAADLIAMYLDPNTKSPISLLELGLYASRGKLLVCCPEGFWRKGNVDMVCHRYKIPQVSSLEELISETQKWVESKKTLGNFIVNKTS